MTYEQQTNQYIEKINSALNIYVEEKTLPQKIVLDAMRYSLLSGGKRIRAILLLEMCKVCGGDVSKALPFACAVEMLHCYSLIHDDLPCMDDDDYRRGQPSCHVKFGEANAMLAGDALLTLAFETMLGADGVDPKLALMAAKTLATQAGYMGMVGGQVIDLQNEGIKASEETIENIYALKTGSLIRASAVMGCIIAGADEKCIAVSDLFAQKIGLSFQIIDDILDIVGDSKKLGKPVGSDAGNEKNTYPAVFGLENAKQTAEKLSAEALELLKELPGDTEYLFELTKALTIREL